ncbi:MAG: HNH endonuclease [Treponema sp.]|nr:HNH endonuclease [Treponema sp.]
MNSLERSLVEKAGYDNGWERSSIATDGRSITLASSMHGFTATVRKGSHEKEWSVRFSNGFPLGELRREFPSIIFHEEEIVPWDYQVLCAILRRAAEIAIAVPDAPLIAFNKELESTLAKQGIPHGTEAERIVKQRIGQNYYRKALLSYWKGACALTGFDLPEVLRASHAKPWAECESDSERLNVYNGFLFTANVDALFDKALISFADDGELLLSTRVKEGRFADLGLRPGMHLRWIEDRHLPFLTWHREHLFIKNI